MSLCGEERNSSTTFTTPLPSASRIPNVFQTYTGEDAGSENIGRGIGLHKFHTWQSVVKNAICRASENVGNRATLLPISQRIIMPVANL